MPNVRAESNYPVQIDSGELSARQTRRDFMLAAATGTAVGGGMFGSVARAAQPESPGDAGNGGSEFPVTFALNTSTIRGQKLPIDEQVAVVAKAGYDGIEPWIRDLQEYVDVGGSITELKKKISDSGLSVVSAIGFAKWIVDDDQDRARALEQMRSDMELVKAIGGTHIAAPPVGAHKPDSDSPSLTAIADRYAAVLKLGEETGVTPQLELWGFSKTLSTLGELAYVAAASNHPDACVLPDFYHIYKGAKDPKNAFAGLSMIEASKMHCFHINDFPAKPSQAQIADKDRVFPGDGVCDLKNIVRGLIDRGFDGSFSLELFNPEYWKRDALEVCKEGLEKCRAVVEQAIG